MNLPGSARIAAISLAALSASFLSAGCAGMIKVQRTQPALIDFKAGPPSLGIVSFEEDAPLANNTRSGDAHATLLAAISDEFKANGGGAVGEHPGALGDAKLHLGEVGDLKSDLVAKLLALPKVPQGVDESIIELIEVNKWRIEDASVAGGDKRREVELYLTFSTWTHDGKPLLAERIRATGTQGMNGPVDVAVYPDDGSQRARDFKAATGHLPSQPGDLGELFNETLKAAVGVHYAPFFAHSITESFFFDGDGPNADGLAKAKAGDWKGAQAAWTQVFTADAKNAGALYSAGVAALVQGDETTALELIGRAIALNDKTTWEWTYKPLKARVAAHKTIE